MTGKFALAGIKTSVVKLEASIGQNQLIQLVYPEEPAVSVIEMGRDGYGLDFIDTK